MGMSVGKTNRRCGDHRLLKIVELVIHNMSPTGQRLNALRDKPRSGCRIEIEAGPVGSENRPQFYSSSNVIRLFFLSQSLFSNLASSALWRRLRCLLTNESGGDALSFAEGIGVHDLPISVARASICLTSACLLLARMARSRRDAKSCPFIEPTAIAESLARFWQD